MRLRLVNEIEVCLIIGLAMTNNSVYEVLILLSNSHGFRSSSQVQIY